MNCKKCNTKLFGDYCHHCGQAIQKKRISYAYLMSQFLGAFINYDTGIIKTIKLLFLRPAYVFNEYIKGNTDSFFSPFKLFFLGVTINFLAIANLTQEQADSRYGYIFENQYIFLLMYIVLLPMRAYLLSLFSKKKLNISEAIIIMLYMHGVFLIIESLFLATNHFMPEIKIPLLSTFVFLFLVLYWIKSALNISVLRSILIGIIIYGLPIIVAMIFFIVTNILF